MRERLLKYILFDMIIIMILCAAHVYEKNKMCGTHVKTEKIVLKYLENNDLRSMIFLFTFF